MRPATEWSAYQSILTMCWYAACNQGDVLTVAALVFPSRKVSSAVPPMSDAFRLLRACPSVYPGLKVPKSVCQSTWCVCHCWCVCVFAHSFPLQHADIIKQLAQSFQPQRGQIIQSALSRQYSADPLLMQPLTHGATACVPSPILLKWTGIRTDP